MNGASFLRELWRGSPWAYLWTPTPDDPKRHGISRWFRTNGDIPDAPADWPNIYFGVHGCKAQGTPYERTGEKAWRIAAINCLYADFDSKHFADGLDGIMRHLDTLPLYPSVTVLSGGGVHAYWIFSNPVFVATREGRERMARAQRLWVDAIVHSDKSAKDLARVLRLPGTFNHKYKPARPVQVIDGEPMRRWHDVETIAEILRPAIRQDEERHKVMADTSDVTCDSWLHLIERARRYATEGNRHRAALWLAHKLKDADAPEQVADKHVKAIMGDDNPESEKARVIRHAYPN